MTDADGDDDPRIDLEEFRSRVAGGGGAMSLVAELNDGIVERSGLDLRTFHLVRAAALAASGGAAVSWQVTLQMLEDVVGADELMGTLIAITPIIGTARYATAIANISGE